MRWVNVEVILIVRKWTVTVLIVGMTLISLIASFKYLVMGSPLENLKSLTVHYECSRTPR